MDIVSKAKELFTRRGGTEVAKEDAQEVKDIARSDASMSDKAKEGFEAAKDPGAPGERQSPSAGERGAATEPREQRGQR